MGGRESECACVELFFIKSEDGESQRDKERKIQAYPARLSRGEQ